MMDMLTFPKKSVPNVGDPENSIKNILPASSTDLNVALNPPISLSSTALKVIEACSPLERVLSSI